MTAFSNCYLSMYRSECPELIADPSNPFQRLSDEKSIFNAAFCESDVCTRSLIKIYELFKDLRDYLLRLFTLIYCLNYLHWPMFRQYNYYPAFLSSPPFRIVLSPKRSLGRYNALWIIVSYRIRGSLFRRQYLEFRT